MVEQKCTDHWQKNEFTFEGVRYIGINHPGFTCDGCALDKNGRACLNAPFCSSVHRNDKRNVIFVEK